MWEILFISLLVGVWIILSILKKSTSKKISPRFRKEIEVYLGKIPSKSYDQQIVSYDKVLDRLLGARGYQGTLGEKMQKYGKYFQDENAIWSAHKLRNRLVHELDVSVSTNLYQKHVRTYKNEIKRLLL